MDGSERCVAKKPRLQGRNRLELGNKVASLSVDLAGGSLAGFGLVREDSVNVLSWDSAVHDGLDPASALPRPLGHFLCLDRWGPATEAEEANGMPFHGEAAAIQWDVIGEASRENLTIEAKLPMGGLAVRRHIEMMEGVALVFVSEDVTNIGKLGRMYNMVQHPSIAPPFLDEELVVDCNGKRGHVQGPERSSSIQIATPFVFPDAINRAGRKTNARRMTGGDDDVLSYEVEPGSPIGWVCATSAKDGFVFGYVWPSKDYPWISLWCSSSEGVPRARGLEFGTTGLHQPFGTLARHPMVFDLPTFAYIDADESCTRRYAMFIVSAPSDFRGVETIGIIGDMMTLVERSVDGGDAPCRKLQLNGRFEQLLCEKRRDR
eukprot:TRINITY_DN26586_c0_g1_i1.p1 TRINITY_DN26586_c0_g1~~TRINITY_DN26586_c0_g1_i1.p1  ORF type:complete len:376 (+),score=47.33 TRINITY_DN26586_c0_g1_i1:73-1200(+)